MRLLHSIWFLIKKLCNKYIICSLFVPLTFFGYIPAGNALLIILIAFLIDCFFNNHEEAKGSTSCPLEGFHEEPPKEPLRRSGISLTKMLFDWLFFDTFFNNHDS